LGCKGMTLLEITVVILVLLSLIAILFVGAQAWKKGSDRTLCIMNIRNVQQGVRAYSNLYGFTAGANAPGLKAKIIGLGRYVETDPACPSTGTYSYGGILGEDTIPDFGQLYMDCDKKTSDEHVPNEFGNW
jgi:prepilin-type N-terminal cleavage/methylation domain-containing protein